jgi:serine/threonine protein kinase
MSNYSLFSENSQQSNSRDREPSSPGRKKKKDSLRNLMKSFSSLQFLTPDAKPQSVAAAHREILLPTFDIEELCLGARLDVGTYSDTYAIKSFRQSPVERNPRDQWARDNMMKKHHAKRRQYRNNSEGRFVVKHIRPEFMGSSHGAFEVAATNLANDAEMMTALHHRHIARLRGTSLHGTEGYYNTSRHDSYFLVLERLQESLAQRLSRWRSRNDRLRLRHLGGLVKGGRVENDFLAERLSVAYDIADGLEYMHEHGIVHKNIQERSIGFNSKNEVQIHDLGEAVQLPPSGKLHEQRSKRNGVKDEKHCLSSPELEACGEYSTKTDVFSFTRILCEILTLRRGGGDSQSREGKACIREFRLLARKIPMRLLELLQNGLNSDPETRPSMTKFRLAIGHALSSLDPARRDAVRHECGRRHRQTHVNFSSPAGNGTSSGSAPMIDDHTETSVGDDCYWENPFNAQLSMARREELQVRACEDEERLTAE